MRREIEADAVPPTSHVEEFIARQFIDQPESFYWDDMPSRLVVISGNVEMEALAKGPTSAGLVLRRAIEVLKSGDGAFRDAIGGTHYGLHLRFARSGSDVAIERIHEIGTPPMVVTESEAPIESRERQLGLMGPARVDARWGDFVDAVERYWRWVLTDHAAEAPWLPLIPEFRQWQQDAGLSS